MVKQALLSIIIVVILSTQLKNNCKLGTKRNYKRLIVQEEVLKFKKIN